MKTIFITSFNPFISRNILSTDVLSVLKSKRGVKIVIFCPDYKKEYFQKNFGSSGTIIEGVAVKRQNRQDVVFNYLSRSLLPTKTMAIHRREIFLRNKKILPFLASYVLVVMSFLPFIKSIVRRLDLATMEKNRFRTYIEKYNPDLLFATDVFNNDDVHFLAEAKCRKIKTVGMVRSWDNTTNKGLMRVSPDYLIVHNGVVKEEAVKLHKFPPDRVFIGGIPQFDIYTTQPRLSKDEFFKKMGLDPNKKTILVAPLGSRFYQNDWYLLELLKTFTAPWQYIVRLPPNDVINMNNFQPANNFVIEHPGKSFDKNIYSNREVTFADSEQLFHELLYCDLVINYGSTITIDAAFFNKPVILIGFDSDPDTPYLKSVRRFFDFTHLAKMIKTRAAAVVFNPKELREKINDYLKNPSLDSAGRKKLAEDQIFYLDGKSGERIGKYLIHLL